MPKKTERPTERKHVHLYKGDWEKLQEFFGDNIGPSEAVRRAVSQLIRRIEDRKALTEQDVKIDAIDLEEIL